MLRIGNQQRHLPTTMPNGFVARKNAIDYRFVHCVRSSFGHLFILLSGCSFRNVQLQEEQEAEQRHRGCSRLSDRTSKLI